MINPYMVLKIPDLKTNFHVKLLLIFIFVLTPAHAGQDLLFSNGFERGLPPDPTDVCDVLSLPRRQFEQGTGFQIGSVAGNFSVNTLNGPWNLVANWTGCDSYLFLTYFEEDADLWQTSPMDLFSLGPYNVHYFFISNENDSNSRLNRVESMRSTIEALWQPEELAFWQDRVHYVTDKFTEIDGSIGEYATAYLRNKDVPLPLVLGIGRDQRFDPGGALYPSVGLPSELGMAAFLGHFYNGRDDADYQFDARPAKLEFDLINETVTERRFLREIDLPGASAMQTFDSLEFDIQVTCSAITPIACSQWNRVASISLCSDTSCKESFELTRWITPYWRRGRWHWVVDASPLLPLLDSGGSKTFQIVMGPDWEPQTEREVTIVLRLWHSNIRRPDAVVPAFAGGSFDQNYNTRDPVTLVLPADLGKLELVLLVSGHGLGADSCAEVCDHRHHFSLNGASPIVIRDQSDIGSTKGCAKKAYKGIPAGQWANWAFGRAFWCPGLPLSLERIDLTDHAVPGSINTLEYEATIGETAPTQDSGFIILSSYLVWYLD